MNIQVIINTNHEFTKTRIEDGAIHEFTTYGFSEGTYDADVQFSCLPAAVDGNALTVILEVVKEITEYGEMIVFYAGVCKALNKFLNRCHGYNKTIEIEGLENLPDVIDVPDDVTEEELEAKIFAILEIERKNTGESVSRIVNSENEEC